jgi:predicted nucleic acid-binding protein
MPRVTFDSNVLINAIDTAEPVRQPLALDLLDRAAVTDAFLTQQALGEFFNVCRKRGKLSAANAVEQVAAWDDLFEVEVTTPLDLMHAALLAERRKKQFWDMLIVRVAAEAGAVALFSEDIGDGEVIDGVRIVNPFDPANAGLVEELLSDAPAG